MNREALEAQMDALMNEATPKESPETSTAHQDPVRETAPRATPNRLLMAALVVGGTLIGALIMGFFQSAFVPLPARPVLEERGTPPVKGDGGDSVLFYVGFGRIRK